MIVHHGQSWFMAVYVGRFAAVSPVQAMSAYQAAGDRLGEAGDADHRFCLEPSTKTTTKQYQAIPSDTQQYQAIPSIKIVSNIFKQTWWFSVASLKQDFMKHQPSSASCDWIYLLGKHCNCPQHSATINHHQPSLISAPSLIINTIGLLASMNHYDQQELEKDGC